MPQRESRCPCGNDMNYPDCCEPLHSRQVKAESPQQLMRSRYSAYVFQLNDYLLATWHPSSRPDTLMLSDQPQWMKLEILSSKQRGDKGRVHFRAFYRDNDDIGYMEEVSDFVCEQGYWFYLRGKVK